uniref:CD80-like immunoglobulin C2-set domain-containing protein n=1 Tax=Timema monikensis TaxID=170555 RepID=A0A7R9HLB6_9NEOP|nr:unnamed protein product [Timema monikensis]
MALLHNNPGELLDSLRGPQVSTPFHPYLPPADGSLTTPVTTPNHPYNFQPLPTRPKSDEGPRISGGRPRYQVGDMVRVNCTSGRSKPAAQLVWFINGQQADSSFLRGPDIVQNGREDLETSVLGLEFRVMPKHFKRGDMKLKCLATIATVYWRSNEESVEGDRPQRTPVLESRETVPPSQSRADRVQGQYTGGVMGREKVQGQYTGGVLRRVGREKVQDQYSGGVTRRVGREKVQDQYSGGVTRRVGREKVQGQYSLTFYAKFWPTRWAP